jgi:hypothetical protein
VIVIESESVRAAMPGVMESHSLPAAMSPDLRKAVPAWP